MSELVKSAMWPLSGGSVCVLLVDGTEIPACESCVDEAAQELDIELAALAESDWGVSLARWRTSSSPKS